MHIITVNIIHVWETRWNNNIIHYLCYCPGLCRNVVLPHHVCIVFLLIQPIATSWCNNWLIQTLWLVDTHVMRKDTHLIHTWERTTFLHRLRPNIDNEFQCVSQPCILLTVISWAYGMATLLLIRVTCWPLSKASPLFHIKMAKLWRTARASY